MDEKDNDLKMIPYVAYESAALKAEKRERRKDYIIVTLILVIAAMFSSVLFFLAHFDFVGYEQYITGATVQEQNINDGIHVDDSK